MRTYNKVSLVVNGIETAVSLEIWKEHNEYHVFEYDENVLVSGYTKMMEFVENWKKKNQNIKIMLEEAGHSVEFIQTF